MLRAIFSALTLHEVVGRCHTTFAWLRGRSSTVLNAPSLSLAERLADVRDRLPYAQ